MDDYKIMNENIDFLKISLDEMSTLLDTWRSDSNQIVQFNGMVVSVVEALKSGNKIIFIGNGGSAAEASHLAGEFVGKCETDVGAQPAISLADSGPILTAIANDWSFEEVFARQVRALGSKGDVIIGLSTSGSSKNVLKGLETGKILGMRTSLWTSQKFSGDDSHIDHLLIAPTKRTPRAQELHLILGHTLCDFVEDAFKK